MAIPYAYAGLRFDQALQKMLPDYSRSRLQHWLKEGFILLDGKQLEPKSKVWGGEFVVVTPQEDQQVLSFVPENIALDIVYEDDALLVINKPAGLVVHPGNGNWSGTLLNGLLHHLPDAKNLARAGIVHRLDKDTSGLMVVAKTTIAQTALVRQLQDKTVHREYRTLVEGIVGEDGTVSAPIARHSSERTKMAVNMFGKPAVTHYEVQGWFRGHTLLHCRLETGRTHQIRVHMQSIGHPLMADPVYGGRPKISSPILSLAIRDFARQALHATKLGLVHPFTGENMEWEVPDPEDFQLLIDALTEDFYAFSNKAPR